MCVCIYIYTLQDIAEDVVLVRHGGAEDEGADERGHPWVVLCCVVTSARFSARS